MHRSSRGNMDHLVAQQQQIYTADTSSRMSLYMGDIDPSFMDSDFLRSTLSHLGFPPSNVKLIRDRNTGGFMNFCFIEYSRHDDAQRALVSLNGRQVPGTHRTFRLNWASGSSAMATSGGANPGAALGLGVNVAGGGASSGVGTVAPGVQPGGPEFSIFVGDLSHDVTEQDVLQLFLTYYRSVRSVKIVTDPNTNLPKGYGFVRFGDEMEQRRAMVEMQGAFCGGRPIRVSVATPKNRVPGIGMGLSMATMGQPLTSPTTGVPAAAMMPGMMPSGPMPPQMMMPPPLPPGGVPPSVYATFASDPTNATLFFANLAPNTSVEAIRAHCMEHADIVYVDYTPDGHMRGYVQVECAQREGAERLSRLTHGQVVPEWGMGRIQVSWGEPHVSLKERWDQDDEQDAWINRESRWMMQSNCEGFV